MVGLCQIMLPCDFITGGCMCRKLCHSKGCHQGDNVKVPFSRSTGFGELHTHFPSFCAKQHAASVSSRLATPLTCCGNGAAVTWAVVIAHSLTHRTSQTRLKNTNILPLFILFALLTRFSSLEKRWSSFRRTSQCCSDLNLTATLLLATHQHLLCPWLYAKGGERKKGRKPLSPFPHLLSFLKASLCGAAGSSSSVSNRSQDSFHQERFEI